MRRLTWPRLRRLCAGLLLGSLLLALPDAGRPPTGLSLVTIEQAKAVDFEQGVVWILALGSDARPGMDMMQGRADAIELIAVDFTSGSAVALGIPRDSWVDFGNQRGFDRINAGLHRGGPELMAAQVAKLTGVTPNYVFSTDLTGFAVLVDAIGGVAVRADRPFSDPDHDLVVERGVNRMTGEQAAGFARSRNVPRDDFGRIANQQSMLLGILQRIRGREDRVDFIEDAAVVASRSLDTDLGPGELYRLAQAISEVRLGRVTTCVLDARPDMVGPISVVRVDVEEAKRLAADAADDAALRRGCG